MYIFSLHSYFVICWFCIVSFNMTYFYFYLTLFATTLFHLFSRPIKSPLTYTHFFSLFHMPVMTMPHIECVGGGSTGGPVSCVSHPPWRPPWPPPTAGVAVDPAARGPPTAWTSVPGGSLAALHPRPFMVLPVSTLPLVTVIPRIFANLCLRQPCSRPLNTFGKYNHFTCILVSK